METSCAYNRVRALLALRLRLRRLVLMLVFAGLAVGVLWYANGSSARFCSYAFGPACSLTVARLDKGIIVDYARHLTMSEPLRNLQQFPAFPVRPWDACCALDLRDGVASQAWVGVPYLALVSLAVAPVVAFVAARRAIRLSSVAGDDAPWRARLAALFIFCNTFFAVVISTMAFASIWNSSYASRNTSHVSWRGGDGYVRLSCEDGSFRITRFNQAAQDAAHFERPPSLSVLMGYGPELPVGVEISQSGFAAISYHRLGLALSTPFGIGPRVSPGIAEGWSVRLGWWYVLLPALWFPFRVLWRDRRERRRSRRDQCLRCGYDLRGSHDRCSECGRSV